MLIHLGKTMLGQVEIKGARKAVLPDGALTLDDLIIYCTGDASTQKDVLRDYGNP